MTKETFPIMPLYDRVFFKDITKEETGLVLPAGAETGKAKVLKVVEVGPGRLVNGERIPLSVKVGDKITLTNQAGSMLSVHKIGTEEKDQVFSIPESYIAGVYK